MHKFYVVAKGSKNGVNMTLADVRGVSDELTIIFKNAKRHAESDDYVDYEKDSDKDENSNSDDDGENNESTDSDEDSGSHDEKLKVVLDITLQQLQFLHKWIRQSSFKINENNIEDLLIVSQKYKIIKLEAEAHNALSIGLSLSEFDQYVLGFVYGFKDITDRYRKVVIEKFEDFCKLHIIKMVKGSAKSGLEVLELVKEYHKQELKKQIDVHIEHIKYLRKTVADVKIGHWEGIYWYSNNLNAISEYEEKYANGEWTKVDHIEKTESTNKPY